MSTRYILPTACGQNWIWTAEVHHLTHPVGPSALSHWQVLQQKALKFQSDDEGVLATKAIALSSCLLMTFFGMVYDNSLNSIKEHPYIESNSQCTDVSSLFIVFLVKQFLRISLFSNSDSSLQFFWKKLLVRQFSIVLCHLYRTILLKHQVFNVLRISLRTQNQSYRRLLALPSLIRGHWKSYQTWMPARIEYLNAISFFYFKDE